MGKAEERAILSTAADKRRYLARFRKQASNAPKLEFLFAIYSIHQVQNARPGMPDFPRDIPQTAITTDRLSEYYFHPWHLETLANELLIAPWKPKQRDGATRTFNPSSFGALRTLYNSLHNAENASDGPSLKRSNVLVQMGRLTKRQFEWQRKFATTSRLNRYHQIYRTEASRAYFQSKYGVSFDSAMKSCFAIYAHLLRSPMIRKDIDGTSIGLGAGDIARTLDVMSLPLDSAIGEARKLRAGYDHIGYSPSILRRFPLIEFNNNGRMHAMCPIPDLIFYRMTEGLFYDFVDAPSGLRNDFAQNLESHVRTLLATAGGYNILDEVSYGKTSEKSPDVFAAKAGRIFAAIEIKGRRQSAPVRFSEDPTKESSGSFEDVAKGIFQLWKYVADSKAGLLPSGYAASEDTALGVCTLDNWIEMGHGVEDAIYRMADDRANVSTRMIPKEVRKRVSIFTINDLDFILSRSNVDGLISTMRSSLSPEFDGWLLSSIFTRNFPEKVKTVPVEPTDDIVPWWGTLRPSNSSKAQSDQF